MREIDKFLSEKLAEREAKVERFIKDTLKIKKLNFWTRLKLKFQRIRIERQYLGDCRESVKIYRKGFLTDGAEFNVMPTFEEARL